MNKKCLIKLFIDIIISLLLLLLFIFHFILIFNEANLSDSLYFVSIILNFITILIFLILFVKNIIDNYKGENACKNFIRYVVMFFLIPIIFISYQTSQISLKNIINKCGKIIKISGIILEIFIFFSIVINFCFFEEYDYQFLIEKKTTENENEQKTEKVKVSIDNILDNSKISKIFDSNDSIDKPKNNNVIIKKKEFDDSSFISSNKYNDLNNRNNHNEIIDSSYEQKIDDSYESN